MWNIGRIFKGIYLIFFIKCVKNKYQKVYKKNYIGKTYIEKHLLCHVTPSTSLFAINEAFESLKKQTAIMLCTRSLKNWAFRQKCINHALQHKPSKLESKNKEQREHALAFIHRNGNKTLARNARGRNKSIRARSRPSFLQSATRWTTATALSQRFSLSLSLSLFSNSTRESIKSHYWRPPRGRQLISFIYAIAMPRLASRYYN